VLTTYTPTKLSVILLTCYRFCFLLSVHTVRWTQQGTFAAAEGDASLDNIICHEDVAARDIAAMEYVAYLDNAHDESPNDVLKSGEGATVVQERSRGATDTGNNDKTDEVSVLSLQ
jgi:hypothetical protein